MSGSITVPGAGNAEASGLAGSPGPRPRRPWIGAALLLLTALALPLYTLGPLDRARWAVVDDHEIAMLFAPLGHVPLALVPAVILHTEVGYPGQRPRFRPAYYALRVTEAWLWGFRPRSWYRARMVLFGASLFLAGWSLASRLGPVATAGLLVWVASREYWFHVWRLGAAEAYAVFGGALWVFGLHLLWPRDGRTVPRTTWREWVGPPCLVVGSVIVVGAKENLLILAVPNLVLALAEMRRGRAGGVRWWACVLAAAAALAVAIPLALYFARVPVDVYGRPVDIATGLSVLARGALQTTPVHVGFALALLLWAGTRIAVLRGRLDPGSEWCRLGSRVVVLGALALALLLSQVVIYRGDIRAGTHYEFPAGLAAPALFVAASLSARAALSRTGALAAERMVQRLTAIVLLVLALLSAGGLSDLRAASRRWADSTRAFTRGITEAAAVARAAADVPIVVTSGGPRDLEPVVAVDRFLRVFGAGNPRHLHLDWEAGRPRWTAFDAHISPELERLSRDGGPSYERLDRLNPAAPCFGIGVSHEPELACRRLGRVDGLIWTSP